MKPATPVSDADSGWIKVHRKLLSWPWFKSPTVVLLWVYCLLHATHRPSRQLVGMKMVNLTPGQLVFGRVAAADKTGLSIKQVRIALDKLIESECLKKGRDKGQHFTIITICNWELYQGREAQRGRDKGRDRAESGPRRGRDGATNKNDKKEEETALALALGNLPVEIGEGAGMIANPEVDLACQWEDLLKLDARPRTEDKDAGDFEALMTVAQDALAGKLGSPDSTLNSLTTLAHQIGNRDPLPTSPLGMFLAEVGKMRLRQSRKPP